jgi:hypothetical protein
MGAGPVHPETIPTGAAAGLFSDAEVLARRQSLSLLRYFVRHFQSVIAQSEYPASDTQSQWQEVHLSYQYT